MKHAVCLFLLAAAPAAATEHTQPAKLAFACNANGAVVETAQGQTIYLGKSCDASIPGLGQGSWWYAASGFMVSVGGQSTKFNNEIPCEALPYCLP